MRRSTGDTSALLWPLRALSVLSIPPFRRMSRHQADSGEYATAMEYYEEAIKLLHEIVSDYVHLLGPDHHDTIIALTYLEYWMLWRSWFDETDGYGEDTLGEVRRLLTTQMRSLGSFHPRTLNTRRNIALVRAKRSRLY